MGKRAIQSEKVFERELKCFFAFFLLLRFNLSAFWIAE
jgi:hypothetical protein